MTTPEPSLTRVPLDPALAPVAVWAAVAAQVRAWADARALSLRDAIVLLPFSALLPPARAAFAALGGWPPRIETPRTLAEASGPPPAAGDAPGGDATLDRLHAATLLAQSTFGADWQARDARGFRFAADAVAAAAGELAQAAAMQPPSERPDWWNSARAAAGAGDGPDAMERALLRLAIEWAAGAPSDDGEGLFGLRPSAWIVVQAGGPDPAAVGLLRAASAPALLIDADPPADDPYIAVANPDCTPALWCCDHFEDEAQATAAQVLQALAAGESPLALVALDRELMRRVRALLERSGVALLDETGWKLSTSRAGARVMAWLRAARPQASGDERLAWLKEWPPAQADAAVLAQLEARWRRQGLQAADDSPLWQAGRTALAALAADAAAPHGGGRPLAGSCVALRDALVQAGEWPPLAADAAGAAVLAALRLDAAGSTAWTALAERTRLSLDGFIAWADQELEAASFTLPTAADSVPEVVLTPLSRALLRPFARIVVPGIDARHLGGAAATPGLIGDALGESLGLASRATRRLRERLAFAQLLRAPALSLLRRRLEGDEPLAASPELQWLMLRRQQAGLLALTESDGGPPRREIDARPVARPLPSAPQSLPPSLSASQVEQLRTCPYQFFARTLLRLSVPEELDRGAEKRDYGSWLHAVLHRFHRDPATGDEPTRLAAAAEAELAAIGFAPAEMLPYRASFEHFAPRYLAWWQQCRAQGWHWREGEAEYRVTPAALSPVGLHGRLDRVDERGATLRVIDYKTTRYDELRRRVANPAEDTQLAFYAALLAGRPPGTLEAGYLTLDEAKAPGWVEHKGVQHSADGLVNGLAEDLRQLRAGAALPALGEGRACDFCDVRGLCRRDHWGPA